MFEWCSIAEMSTSSPAPTRVRPKACATRLMLSVALRVKMIWRSCGALKNAPILRRAFSYASLAISLSSCTPRWTLALYSV